MYNGDIDDDLDIYMADKVSFMLGYAIIRQLRVKKGTRQLSSYFEIQFGIYYRTLNAFIYTNI